MILSFQTQHPSLQDPGIEAELFAKYYRAEGELEAYWKQRACLSWHFEGDRNTTFFHTIATNRKRANQILQIQDENGTIVADEALVRGVFIRYYKNLYSAPMVDIGAGADQYFQQFGTGSYQQVPTTAHGWLDRVPTREEIKETLFQMSPDKAPGPDGITARFLQANWDTMAEDMTRAIRKVFESGKPPTDWMKSRIVLIPKIPDPLTPKDYRLITVGNISYRLLMKIIANRIQPHIAKVISNTQTAFIKNRNISDNTILVREVLHSFQSKGYKEGAFMLKADISKAFDTVA